MRRTDDKGRADRIPGNRRIQEQLERREAKIRLKIESILEETDDEIFNEMVMGLDDEERNVFIEVLDERADEFMGEEEEKFEGLLPMYEMANLLKNESGLPYDIWLDSAGKDRKVPHNIPRIKIKIGEEMIPVILYSMDDIRAKKEFRRSGEVIQWVKNNYDIIMRHWNKEISDRQALNMLAKK